MSVDDDDAAVFIVRISRKSEVAFANGCSENSARADVGTDHWISDNDIDDNDD